MATKVIKLGKDELKKGKPIKFVKVLAKDELQDFDENENCGPGEWDNILLLSLNYDLGGMDLMFAYDGNGDEGGVLFLGHFNDGIVHQV